MKAKKILSLVLAVLLTASVLITPAFAATAPGNTLTAVLKSVGMVTYKTNASNAILYDVDAGITVYKKNATKKIDPASITKLATALTVLKYAKLSDVYTVGTEITLVPNNASVAELVQGEKLTVEQLLYALLLPSGADAAYTLAVNVARSRQSGLTDDKKAISAFVNLLNSYTQELKMDDSHFAGCWGAKSDKTYTTISDLLILVKKALSSTTISKICSTSTKTINGHTWTNTNALITPGSPYYTKGFTGVKTGTLKTSAGEICLLASCYVQNGHKVIMIVLSSNDNNRYIDTRNLLNKYLA